MGATGEQGEARPGGEREPHPATRAPQGPFILLFPDAIPTLPLQGEGEEGTRGRRSFDRRRRGRLRQARKTDEFGPAHYA